VFIMKFEIDLYSCILDHVDYLVEITQLFNSNSVRLDNEFTLAVNHTC
jgi:hypothetical protein